MAMTEKKPSAYGPFDCAKHPGYDASLVGNQEPGSFGFAILPALGLNMISCCKQYKPDSLIIYVPSLKSLCDKQYEQVWS